MIKHLQAHPLSSSYKWRLLIRKLYPKSVNVSTAIHLSTYLQRYQQLYSFFASHLSFFNLKSQFILANMLIRKKKFCYWFSKYGDDPNNTARRCMAFPLCPIRVNPAVICRAASGLFLFSSSSPTHTPSMCMSFFLHLVIPLLQRYSFTGPD